jgi:cytochrome c peroxidase
MNQDLAELERELNAIPVYVRQFEAAFGKKPDREGVANALAAFQRTLVTGPAPFDRYLAGDKSALSADAVRGLELFQGDAGCIRCHKGPLLSDGEYYRLNAGRPDDGRVKITNKDEDRGRFRTPSLRNIAETGPYMHDGSLATLDDVVTFYYRGINSPAGGLPADADALAGQSFSEIPLIVEFLKSLSGKLPEIQPPLLPSLLRDQDETLVSPGSIDEIRRRTPSRGHDTSHSWSCYRPKASDRRTTVCPDRLSGVWTDCRPVAGLSQGAGPTALTLSTEPSPGRRRRA